MTHKKGCPVVYGPVPSRRLGFSLGVDILPFKTCSLDCQYCQLGPTPHTSSKRRGYGSVSSLVSQIREAVGKGRKIDFITFSGSGEPTLNKKIGRMIKAIQKNFSIPVAVLTNSTMLTHRSVRKALRSSDLVVPSLDAATQDVFVRLNRPSSNLHIRTMIQGLKTFQQNFSGQLWLEVMLAKGINDSKEHLKKLKAIIQEIQPDLIQLNTVVRPPAFPSAAPLSWQDLENVKHFLGEKCEIIADFERKDQSRQSESTKNDILTMIRRRPVTLEDLEKSLGRHRNELLKYLDALKREERIIMVSHKEKYFYEPASPKTKEK